jgi:pyrimidine oxygenase
VGVRACGVIGHDVLDLGVFLPITNNGWIISHASPQFSPSFAMNRDIALTAEDLGFRFAFSMVKWRGFGGDFGYWDEALESVTLMAGLAAVTSRIELIGSVQPLTLHPAVAARMALTVDDISGGRFGLNLVGGSNRDEYDQMGLWPGESYYHDRYDHLTEWTEIVTELWEQGASSRKGRYYNLEDCRLQPRPTRDPRPSLISAGMSERGMAFSAAHCDASFVAGFGLEATKEIADQVHRATEATGRDVKCYGTFTVIGAPTDAEAQARLRRFDEAVDLDTLAKIGRHVREDVSPGATMRAVDRGVVSVGSSIFSPVMVGSPSTIVEQLHWLSTETRLDGVMLTFPDWYGDLAAFGESVVPTLKREGLMRADLVA